MNRRTFLTGAGGIASTTVAGCAGILGDSGGGWNGEDVDQYLPWLAAPPRNAALDQAYLALLTDVERGRAINDDSSDLFESGNWLIPDIAGLDSSDVERTLQVAIPQRTSHGNYLVCFGAFDADAVRQSVLANTDEEPRSIGEATMLHDSQSDKWIGIGPDWIVTQGPVVFPGYETERMVTRALETIAGDVATVGDRTPATRRLTEQASLHHSLGISYFEHPESQRYGASEFPSLPLVGETIVDGVRNDQYQRRERYVFADGARIVERPFEERVADQIEKYYDDGSYAVEDGAVTIEFNGPVGSQPE